MEKISDVKYMRDHLRMHIEEVGSMTMLAKSCGTNRYTLHKVLAGKDLRLKTVDVLAKGCGKTVAEMFLAPGIKTDWYKEATLQYFPDNLWSAMTDRGMEMIDMGDGIIIVEDGVDRMLRFNVIDYFERMKKDEDGKEQV